MKLRNDAAYALLFPTRMGVRVTPPDGHPMHTSDRLYLQVTSAESNVAGVSSYLGLPVKVLTAFVSVLYHMVVEHSEGLKGYYDRP